MLWPYKGVFVFMTGRFFLGCAVWAHKDWVGELFPAGSKSADLLNLYSRRLTTVEGNTTFYATPGEQVVARWAAETPDTFRFCLKLPRDVSHAGALVPQIAQTRSFVERMQLLGPRLGPFFLQLPPSFHPRQLPDLAQWLAAWPAEERISVEVRHIDWFAPAAEHALSALLAQHHAGRVLMDVRPLDLGHLPGAEEDMRRARDNKPAVPLHLVQTSNIALVRFIGHPDADRNLPLIDDWAGTIAGWLAAGVDVYFFMHCPVERISPTLCWMLQERLLGVPGVPPLPWTSADDPPRQASLF